MCECVIVWLERETRQRESENVHEKSWSWYKCHTETVEKVSSGQQAHTHSFVHSLTQQTLTFDWRPSIMALIDVGIVSAASSEKIARDTSRFASTLCTAD